MGRRRFDRDRRYLVSGAAGGGSIVPQNYAPPTVSGANLRCWLEPSDITTGINTIVSGGFTSVGDKTGTHAPWTQSGAASFRPTTSTIGGRQCLRFTQGPTTWLLGPTFATNFALGVHTFWVLQPDLDPEATSSPHHKFDANTVGNNLYPFIDGIIYDGYGSTTRKTVGNPAPSLTTPHVYEVISIAGEHTFRINDVTINTFGANVVGWDPAQSILGAGSTTLGTNPPTNFSKARHGTKLDYDAKLSASDATAVINSLKAWWSIA